METEAAATRTSTSPANRKLAWAFLAVAWVANAAGHLSGGPGHELVVASVGLALGALREVVAWGFDQLVAGDVIRGKRDTILDLVMNTGVVRR